MRYKVLDTFAVGGNTSVTVEGNGDGLKNDMLIRADDGTEYHLISVAMISGQPLDEAKETTAVLLEGIFKSDIIIVE